jgi:hypothetical protein
MSEGKKSEVEKEIDTCFSMVVRPAFEELKRELEKGQKVACISITAELASLQIEYHGETEFIYSLKPSIKPNGRAFLDVEEYFKDPTDGQFHRLKDFLRSGSQDYFLDQLEKDEIIKHFHKVYKAYLDLL